MKLYLNYGFRPLVRSAEEEVGWIKLREHITHPLLDEPFWTESRIV